MEISVNNTSFSPSCLSTDELADIDRLRLKEIQIVNESLYTGHGKYSKTLGAPIRDFMSHIEESINFGSVLRECGLETRDPGILIQRNNSHFEISSTTPGPAFVRSFHLPHSIETLVLHVHDVTTAPYSYLFACKGKIAADGVDRTYQSISFTVVETHDAISRTKFAGKLTAQIFDEKSSTYKYLCRYAKRKVSAQGTPPHHHKHFRKRILSSLRSTLYNFILAALIEQDRQPVGGHMHHDWKYTRRWRGFSHPRMLSRNRRLYFRLCQLLFPIAPETYYQFFSPSGADRHFAALFPEPEQAVFWFIQGQHLPSNFKALRRRLSRAELTSLESAIADRIAKIVPGPLYCDRVYRRHSGEEIALIKRIDNDCLTSSRNGKATRGIQRIISTDPRHIYSIAWNSLLAKLEYGKNADRLEDIGLHASIFIAPLIDMLNNADDSEINLRAAAVSYRKMTHSRRRQRIFKDILQYIHDAMRCANFFTAGSPDFQLIREMRSARSVRKMLELAKVIHDRERALRRLQVSPGALPLETRTFDWPEISVPEFDELSKYLLSDLERVESASEQCHHCIRSYGKSATLDFRNPTFLMRDSSDICASVRAKEGKLIITQVKAPYNKETKESRSFKKSLTRIIDKANDHPHLPDALQTVIARQQERLSPILKQIAISNENVCEYEDDEVPF